MPCIRPFLIKKASHPLGSTKMLVGGSVMLLVKSNEIVSFESRLSDSIRACIRPLVRYAFAFRPSKSEPCRANGLFVWAFL